MSPWYIPDSPLWLMAVFLPYCGDQQAMAYLRQCGETRVTPKVLLLHLCLVLRAFLLHLCPVQRVLPSLLLKSASAPSPCQFSKHQSQPVAPGGLTAFSVGLTNPSTSLRHWCISEAILKQWPCANLTSYQETEDSVPHASFTGKKVQEKSI